MRSPSALLDHVAEMNAYAELDAPVDRHAGVALDHRVLELHRTTHGIDDTAEFHERAVAGALDDPSGHRHIKFEWSMPNGGS